MAPLVYIIYNAKASILGKLNYVYRKVNASKDESICAACDLTHGGINLTETEEWKETKAKVGADVKQLHLDELTEEVKSKPILTIPFIPLDQCVFESIHRLRNCVAGRLHRKIRKEHTSCIRSTSARQRVVSAYGEGRPGRL